MIKIIFSIIVAIVIFDFVLDQFLTFLNRSNWSNKLPEELDGIYDPENYKKQQNYKKENEKLSMITESFSFIIIMLMLFLNGFAFVDNLVRNWTDSPILISLLFFGILFFCSDILSTPFAIYDTFVVEEKYGFNKTTPLIFIMDKLKGYLLTVLIGGGLISLFIWFYQVAGVYFWLYTWGLVSAFSIFMSMFYSNLIVPIFNKQTPLEDGELRNAIQEFSIKAGFKLKNIFVIDGSKRSNKANAYFTGLGAKKRIVLYDTLIKQLTTNENVAVLAHEIGHYKKKHTLTGLFLSIIQTGLTLFILSVFINNPLMCNVLGATKPGIHIGLITFGILYSPISTILGLAMNILSRENEYQADAYVKQFNLNQELIQGLKTLTKNSLSNLTPHPLYVFFNYSHPTLLQRIRALK